jgi:membrane protein YdbS with pleckstrin-like domain
VKPHGCTLSAVLWWIGFTFFLFVLGTVQIFLTPVEERTNGWLHGLHGMLALVVMVIAAIIAHRGMRDLGLRGDGGRRHDELAGADRPPPPQ